MVAAARMRKNFPDGVHTVHNYFVIIITQANKFVALLL